MPVGREVASSTAGRMRSRELVIIRAVDDLAGKLSEIVVNATSPDGNITVQARHGDQVDVRFRPGTFRTYNGRQLEHQLRQLAALTWTKYRRDHLEVTELVLGPLIDDTELRSRQDIEFWDRLEQLSLRSDSPAGAVGIRSRALASWEFTIDDSLLARMGEHDFLTELRAAVAATLADYRSRVILLKDEIYGLGLPRPGRTGAR
jgi:hypothetical protein